jgi:2-polyprenyl-3-methyl-5-hydroxy-6-metoxy-1,4-benzoquinol methylase
MATFAAQIEDSRTADALAERLLNSTAGALEMFSIYLGDKLGFYQVISEDGPLTSRQLANRTGTQERYVREWLEQQAAAGFLAVENPRDPALQRRFYLTQGHSEVLADANSLNFLAPLAQLLVGVSQPLDALLQAYRQGHGVPYEAYGPNGYEGQARINRTMFLELLGKEWLPSIADVDARLNGATGARVADIGCGAGWSSIGIASSYPRVTVDGFDPDEASIALARRNAADYGMAGRVRFESQDAAKTDGTNQYDLVLAIECIHDMSNPVAVLSTMKRLAKEDGAVIVVDERVAEQFEPEAELVERMMYGWSILHCLPVGLSGHNCRGNGHTCAGTGTVMRPSVLEGYVRKAGFSRMEVLPIEHIFFRFYRLY